MAESRFNIRQLASWLGLDWTGESLDIGAISTDTRSLRSGELFVALTGPNHDGHDHVAAAEAAGAAALLVSRPVNSSLPQIVVDDTRLALGQLGRGWRHELSLPLVAITGSNGKTTVKEMVAAILAQAGRARATHGNLNNDIGVPLTLLTFDRDDEYAVIEMGANHAGEIAYLGGLVSPDVAIVTNAGGAHLEGFGSLEGVAEAKGELFSCLASNGVAVINADDRFAPRWREMALPHRVIAFSLDGEADVTGHWTPHDGGGVLTLHYLGNRVEIPLALTGEHNARNALAASAAALALGLSLPRIARGLASMVAVPGRLERLTGLGSASVINDSYNANPASFSAAIEVLAAESGRRILVIGDMGELGSDAVALHAAVGREAREAGLDGLFATGTLSRAAVEAFGDNAHYFENQQALISALREQLDSDVTLLVKGSRSSRMERVVAALTNEREELDAALP